MTNDRPDRNTGTGTLLDPRDWNNRLASLRDNESETVREATRARQREKQRERGSERTEKRTDVLIFFLLLRVFQIPNFILGRIEGWWNV
jgi:hypothetical protein